MSPPSAAPSRAPPPAAPSTLAVTVALGGALYVDKERVDEKGLIAALKRAAAENPEATLVVSADRRVTHGEVMHVIDLAKLEGIARFAINVEEAK
jgi:biopolymer transport protein ExbD